MSILFRGIENRAEKVVDRRKNGGEEILNRCKYGRCHRLNGSDNGGEGIGNRRPSVDEKVPDSGNNSREKGSNAVPLPPVTCSFQVTWYSADVSAANDISLCYNLLR